MAILTKRVACMTKINHSIGHQEKLGQFVLKKKVLLKSYPLLLTLKMDLRRILNFVKLPSTDRLFVNLPSTDRFFVLKNAIFVDSCIVRS
jgi:hypothetical protein